MRLSKAFPIHPIGGAESPIAVDTLGAALAARPASRLRTRALCGLALAVVVASLVAPLASTAPDGLERVAADSSFDAPAITCVLPSVVLAGWIVMSAVYLAGHSFKRAATVQVRKQ